MLKKWFFDWLERSGRHRIIIDRTGTVPYMHRYYLMFKDKLNEFDGNFERAEMVKAFIVSGEYRDRFPR